MAVAPAPAVDDLPDLAEADIWYLAADSERPCPAASRPVDAEDRTPTAGGVGAGRAARRGVSLAFWDGPRRQGLGKVREVRYVVEEKRRKDDGDDMWGPDVNEWMEWIVVGVF